MRKYYYIDIPKTWHDAQTYCRENYDELAIFYSMEDIQLLSKPQPFSSAYSWIGLSDDTSNWKTQMGKASNSWIWTATGKPSRTGYQKFDLGEPNNYASAELCILLTNYGAWRDVSCVSPKSSVCMTNTTSGVTYTYVSNSLIWSDALAYCRQHYTDLAMIEDDETYNKVIQSRPSVNTWIGLVRQAWVWADGSLVTDNNWQGGKPTGDGTTFCVKEEETMHQWITDKCENLNPFICHKGKFYRQMEDW
ncbi:hypothetical protein NL108_015488 [Boleophthalmus pectinirostris]|nr:hypothetical protein NL108_015488 [Boleophthalmus pectinirostris]